MQKGQKATNSKHKGVSLITRDGVQKMRWLDPVTGKRREQGVADLTLAEVEELAIAKMEEIRRTKALLRSEQLIHHDHVEDLLEAWIQDANVQSTADNRRKACRWLETVGIHNYPEVKRSDLTRIRTAIGKSHLGGYTRNITLGIIRAFFRNLVERGLAIYLTGDIIRAELRGWKAAPTKKGRHFTQTEMVKLMTAFIHLRPDLAPFYWCLSTLGCRIGELTQVKGSDLTLGKHSKPTLQVWGQKTNRYRKLNLEVSPRTLEILEALKSLHGDGYLFFPEKTGTASERYKHAQLALQDRISKRSRVKATPKDLRSTAEGYLMHLQGWNAQKAAKMIGHGLDVLDRNYADEIQFMKLEDGCETMEEAMGIESLGEAVLQTIEFDPINVHDVAEARRRNEKLDEQLSAAMLADNDLLRDAAFGLRKFGEERTRPRTLVKKPQKLR